MIHQPTYGGLKILDVSSLSVKRKARRGFTSHDVLKKPGTSSLTPWFQVHTMTYWKNDHKMEVIPRVNDISATIEFEKKTGSWLSKAYEYKKRAKNSCPTKEKRSVSSHSIGWVKSCFPLGISSSEIPKNWNESRKLESVFTRRCLIWYFATPCNRKHE